MDAKGETISTVEGELRGTELRGRGENYIIGLQYHDTPISPIPHPTPQNTPATFGIVLGAKDWLIKQKTRCNQNMNI